MFSGGTVAVLLSYAMLYSMLFAMSFALVRGYHDMPLKAGLRLALVPVAIGVVAHFMTLSHDLKAFCAGLPAGMPISEVREAAEEHGYDPRMEPYAQMSIEPTGWLLSGSGTTSR